MDLKCRLNAEIPISLLAYGPYNQCVVRTGALPAPGDVSGVSKSPGPLLSRLHQSMIMAWAGGQILNRTHSLSLALCTI